MSPVASLRMDFTHDLKVIHDHDRGSWAILRGRSDTKKPMDPAGGLENAKSSVSHPSLDGASRPPQFPQAQPPNHFLRPR